jgi:hypothetical protein
VSDTTSYAEAVQAALAAVLRDSGHPTTADCVSGQPPTLQADSDGTQLAVCGCGIVVEIPGGIEMQLRARGLAPDAPPPVAADPVQPGLPLIDPSEIATPEQLEAHLLDVIQRLETGQLFERDCIEAEYSARLAWELAKAKTIAKGGGAADVRMAAALADHGDLYEKYLRAEMMRKATQAAMHNCRSMLSGYQTVARSVLTTYQAGGSAGPNNQPQRGRY